MIDERDIYHSFDDWNDEDGVEELDECTLVHETDAAWLISDGERQAWFPKSRCRWNEDEGLIIWPDWLDPEWREPNPFKSEFTRIES